MLDTIICSAEPEPFGFHPAGKAGFSVRLSFEAGVEAGDEDTRKLKEAEARGRFEAFLARLKHVEFFTYQRNGDFLDLQEIPVDASPPNQFDPALSGYFISWLQKQPTGRNPIFFATPPSPDEEKEILADSARAVHLLQGAATWTAPAPHKLGLTHVLRFERTAVAAVPADSLVIVPFFDEAKPEPRYTIEPGERLEFEYYPVVPRDQVLCRATTVAIPLEVDPTSLVDPTTGFIMGDERAQEIYPALKQLGEKSGSLLAVLPAVLSAKWPSIPTQGKVPDNASDVTYRRLVWRAVTSLVTSLDSIIIALLMPGKPGAAEREGPLLAPLVDLLRRRLGEARSETTRLFQDRPDAIAKALRAALESRWIIAGPGEAARSAYANDLTMVTGIRTAETGIDANAAPLLALFIKAFVANDAADDDPPNLLDEIPALRDAIFGTAETVHLDKLEERHGFHLNDRLDAELAPIVDAVQGEAGIENAIIRLLASEGVDSKGNEKSFDEMFAEAVPAADRAEAMAACKLAREDYKNLLAEDFNGAEAVRQACSAVYVDLLTSPWPDDVQMLRGRLESSDMFVSRVIEAPEDIEDNPLHAVLIRVRNPAPGWLDEQAFEGLKSACSPLRTVFADVVDTLFPDANHRRFVPASAPPPLPLQITVDRSTKDIDEFNNQFAGMGLLVRRSEAPDDGSPRTDWAYANLAELMLRNDKDELLHSIADIAIHPMQSVETDGRRELFLEYAGLPFTSDAYSATRPDDMPAAGGKRAFYTIDYPGDPTKPDGHRKLPPLAYGARFDIVGYVVSKGGVLPYPLQDSDDEPWRPEATVDEGVFPALRLPVIQAFPYSRLTAIGRTVITEPGTAARRIGTNIAGVQPLAADYPRIGLSALGSKKVFLDVLRGADGAGTIDIPDVGRETRLDLSEFWWWGGPGTLVISLLDYAAATDGDDRPLAEICLPVEAAEGEIKHVYSALRLILKHTKDAGLHTYSLAARLGLDGTEMPAEFRPADPIKPVWLRLRLAPDDTAENSSISFADPSAALRGAGTAARALTDSLVLVAAPKDSKAKLWKHAVDETVKARIEFPRMGYADFDRWLNNADLRDTAQEGAAGEGLVARFRRLLLVADMVRTLNESVAARLERLPDLAVAGLLLQLTPCDSLRGDPRVLLADAERRKLLDKLTLVVPLASLWKTLQSLETLKPLPDGREPLDDPNLSRIVDVLAELDEKLSVPTEISCAETVEQLSIKREDGGVAIRIPGGMTVQLSARPLVPLSHFDKRAGIPSVIDERLLQLTAGRYTDTDNALGMGAIDYHVFPGAALTVESMIGPLRPARTHWAGLAGEALRHAPAGSARTYQVKLDPAALIEHDDAPPPGPEPEPEPVSLPAPLSDPWTWRELAFVDISTQRWRFTGRPIYSWMAPPRPAGQAASVRFEDDRRGLLARFEAEAFFDRDDLDADVKKVRLDPAPAATMVLKVDWEQPSATLFRHRLAVQSRYAAAMLNPSHGATAAWEDIEDKDKPASWFRIAMLADRSRIQLTRPQLRALVPLTTTPDGAGSSPPVLAVLQERPFDYGGLADRVAAEIRTGIGYEARVDKVEPADARKEVGRDPRLTYRGLPAAAGSGLVLAAEGPVGLTFDAPAAPAPAFPNSLLILQPTNLADGPSPVPFAMEEHFLSVGLRRYLDHRWLVGNTEAPRLDASWWHQFKIAGRAAEMRITSAAPDLRVCWMEAVGTGDARTVSAYLNPRAIDPTAPDIPAVPRDPPNPLLLCRMSADEDREFAVLHIPLEEGRFSLSIFSVPPTSPAAPQDLAGGGNLPILLASTDWSIPQDIKQPALEVLPAGQVCLTSTSPTTALNWTRTNKNFERAFARLEAENGHVAEERSVPIADLAGRLNGAFAFDARTSSEGTPDEAWRRDVWVRPEQWSEKFPLHTQRHLALLFSGASGGLGRPLDVFSLAARLMGKGTVAPIAAKKRVIDAVRIVEFETPAIIIGYLPSVGAAGFNMPSNYRAGYFDLKAIGFDRQVLKDKPFRASIFARLVACSATRSGLQSIKLTLRADAIDKWKTLPLVNSSGDKGVLGFFVQIGSEATGQLPSCSGQILYDDGTLGPTLAATGPELSVKDGLVLQVEQLIAAGKEAEGWLEASILATAPGPDGELSTEPAQTHFSFDWFFTGIDQAPEVAVSEARLRSMVEAQARIVAVSPPIPVV